jgi:hypothetical protein
MFFSVKRTGTDSRILREQAAKKKMEEEYAATAASGGATPAVGSGQSLDKEKDKRQSQRDDMPTPALNGPWGRTPARSVVDEEDDGDDGLSQAGRTPGGGSIALAARIAAAREKQAQRSKGPRAPAIGGATPRTISGATK